MALARGLIDSFPWPVFFRGGELTFRKKKLFKKAMSQLDADGVREFDYLDVSKALNKLGLHNTVQVKEIPLTLKCFKRQLGIELVGKFRVGDGHGFRCLYKFEGT